MKSHVGTIATMIAAALACAATFLLALFRQYGLVEVAASLGAGLEVFFLSSSIGDYLEDRPEPNRLRIVAALVLAAAIVGYFLLTIGLHGRGA
jgi:ABC-type thiamin/hydroxymethylpyrimidine transport system permease subunit